MNIAKIIKKCNYGSNYNSDNIDLYKNAKLSQSVDFIEQEDDLCLELQTIQNLFSGIESNGSSYKYTITVPNINSNLFEFFDDNSNEKIPTSNFDNFNNFNKLLIIIILIGILSFMIINIIHLKFW